MMRYILKYRSNTAVGILLILGLVLASPEFAQTAEKFTGTSWSNFSVEIEGETKTGAKAVCEDEDIDNDNDGLIELCYLEDVDAIRHKLDGSGFLSTSASSSMSASTTTTVGCGGGGSGDKCFGYELVRDLDFNEDDSYRNATANMSTWTTGEGWRTIGSGRHTFTGTLEGNGHSIKNLFKKSSSVQNGFLGTNRGSIRNLGLLDVNVTELPDIGYAILADVNGGTIINCYIKGTITNSNRKKPPGGVVRINRIGGNIRNTYANITHEGLGSASYFVDESVGTISDSYYIGSSPSPGNLVRKNGLNRSISEIRNMYVVSDSIFGVAGTNTQNSRISNVYGDTTVSGSFSAPTGGSVSNVRGFTTTELQSPTGPGTSDTDPYYTWSENNWDFGTTEEYPALRHRERCGESQQPACGSLLRGQGRTNNLPVIVSPGNNASITLSQGIRKKISVTVTDLDTADKLTLSLTAAVPDQEIVELVTPSVLVQPSGNTTRVSMALEIRALKEGTAQLKLVATDDSNLPNARSEDEVLLNVIVGEEVETTPTIIRYDSPVTVQAGRDKTISVTVSDANTDDELTLLLTAAVPEQDIVKVVTTSVTVMTNGNDRRTTQTLTITGLKAGEATLDLTVSDAGGLTSEATVTVTVGANTEPTITPAFPDTISLQEGKSTALDVTIDDEDDDDEVADFVLSVESSMPTIASVMIAEGDGATRQLTITGESEGEATITATVDDGRGQNSTASLVFTVTVKAKATPMIVGGNRAVEVKAGREKTISVTVSDANTDDELTLLLTAAVPEQDIVKVVTTSVTVMTNGNITRDAQLTIEGLKDGETTLNLTVSDRDTTPTVVSVTVKVEANTQPTITTTFPETSIKLLAGDTRTTNVTIDDKDNDDDVAALKLTVTVSRPEIAGVTVEGSGGTRQLNIEGLSAGMATITATVNDRREQPNSTASLVFTVTVEANTTPTITINPSTRQTMQVGSMTDIAVSVEDADYNLNDKVTLTAMSSGASVTVVPAEIAEITDNRARTFTLTADAVGDAEITFTATDSKGTSDSKTVLVQVNAPQANTTPTIMTTFPDTISLLKGNSTASVVMIADEDDDDVANLEISVESSDTEVATATITTLDETHTLTIRGVRGGTATITATVDDGRKLTNSTDSLVFTVTVKATPMITNVSPESPVTVKAGREQDITAMVSDENIDDMLTLSLTAEDADIVEVVTASVAVPTNDSAMRDAQTLRIKGLKAGETTLNLIVSDGDLTSDEISVRVMVEANTTPTIMTTFPDDTISLLEGNSTASVVMIADDDDDDVANLEISVESSDTEVATATITTLNETHMLTITGEGAGIATITATVDDGRKLTNSTDSLVFTVTVEENKAPTITISPSADQTMQLGSTASIVVHVSDENFDVGDLVTVKAVSSTPSVVAVEAPSPIVGIKDNMDQRFVIRGDVAGESRIKFTATDSKDAITSASVLVHVNTPPEVTDNVQVRVVATIGQELTLDTSGFFKDADEDDTLSYSITTSGIMPVSLATRLTNGFSSTGTLTFTPIRTEASTSAAGQTVTVSVDDGRGSSATATFKLLINAEPTGGVSIVADSDDEWLLRAESTVTDANGIASTTYQWYRAAGLITGETAATYVIPNTPEGRAGETIYRVDVTFVDNIDESSEIFSATHTIDNKPPAITGFDAPTMAVDEGDSRSVSVEASDANYDELTYSWTAVSGDTAVDVSSSQSNPDEATLTIPDDLVAATTNTTTLILEVEVSDGGISTTKTVSVVVNKVNNGQISAGSIQRDSDNPGGFRLSNIGGRKDPDGKADVNVSYQWQRCWKSEDGVDCSEDSEAWLDIGGETGNSYKPTTSIEGHVVQSEDRFRVALEYTDGQGYDESVPSLNTLSTDPSSDIKIRIKVFLEGPLQ